MMHDSDKNLLSKYRKYTNSFSSVNEIQQILQCIQLFAYTKQKSNTQSAQVNGFHITQRMDCFIG